MTGVPEDSSLSPETRGLTLDRRSLLRGGVALGGVAALATQFLGTAPAAEAAEPHHRRVDLVLDVAMIGSSFSVTAKYNTDAIEHGDLRGCMFYVEGPIYRGFTIPNEAHDWDPAQHQDEEIGYWFNVGSFMNFPGRPNPHLYSTQTHVLGHVTADNNFPVDQICSTGTEASLTQDTKPSTRSITGGAGRYFGAAGQIRLFGNGTNVTFENVFGRVGPAPNLRMFFTFTNRRSDSDHAVS
jgi:hypothetical protein